MATKTTQAKGKVRTEAQLLAAKANEKAQPSARISSKNIERVRAKLGKKSPDEVLGISVNTLGQLAAGKKRKGDLPEDQRLALREFGSALGSDTYYGKKLAGMLWSIATGVK